MKNLTELPEWEALSQHKKTIAAQHMRDWFRQDSGRFDTFSLHLDGLLFDFSKNRITSDTLALLNKLACATDLKEKITALFAGEPVNGSEKRAALHTALRAPASCTILQNGKNIMPAIHAAQNQMRHFTQQIRDKKWRGITGKAIQSIVNVGIGGSHLGPQMTIHALKAFASEDLTCHFISNIDPAHLEDVLKKIDPETTLFIISSKSFTTLETITNATTLRNRLQAKWGPSVLQKHFVAITAAPKAALDFGIPIENIFPLWDWVGGRYSIWSTIGLPLALMIGMDAFLDFLAGGHAMDQHFQQTPFLQNMPVIMALLGIWYVNFFGASHHAIVPYAHHLEYLRVYLQQLDMESNGKHISQQGNIIDFLTGPVILGEQGCNGQHAFHQLLHQGKHFIPVDFILVGDRLNFSMQHDILIGSALSQAQALMCGKTLEEALAELCSQDESQEESQFLALHKTIPGNRPSNILFLDKMAPYQLGMLIALYEHKTFVQGAIWGINSFDQWGVELGKQLLPRILDHLQIDSTVSSLDSSTQGLIAHYKQLRK